MALEFLDSIANSLVGVLSSGFDHKVEGSHRINDPLNRKKPERKYFHPIQFYDPLFGVPGLTEAPTSRAGRINLPVMLREQPSQQLFGGMDSNREHWMTSDPNFWKAYHSRKGAVNTWNYDPNMQLGYEHYPHRSAVRMRDNQGYAMYSVNAKRKPMPVNENNFCHGKRFGFHGLSAFALLGSLWGG